MAQVQETLLSLFVERSWKVSSVLVRSAIVRHLLIKSRDPMCVPGCQLRVIGGKYLFHQYRSVRELSSLSVILSCSRRCVRVVHLGVVVEIDRCIYSKRLIAISNISRLSNVSRLVYEIEALDAVCTLGSDRLVTR